MNWLRFPPIMMLLTFAPAAIGWRYLDRSVRPPFLIYGIRWFLGLLFLYSGLAKLIPGFPNTMGPNNLEFVLEPHGLAAYGRFIAVSEAVTGLLLLTRRFATLGALLLVPILVSIIVITTSLQWIGTPYLVSVFLLLALVLLAYDYPKLMVLLADRGSVTSTPQPLPRLIAWGGALGLLSAVLFLIRFASPGIPGVWLLLAAIIALVVWDWSGKQTG